MRHLFLMFRGFLTYRRRKYIHQRPRRCCPTSWRRALGHAASRRTVGKLWFVESGAWDARGAAKSLRPSSGHNAVLLHGAFERTPHKKKKKARHLTHLCFGDMLPLCLRKTPQQTFFPARGAKHTPVLPPRHIPGCPSPVSHLLWFFVECLGFNFHLTRARVRPACIINVASQALSPSPALHPSRM